MFIKESRDGLVKEGLLGALFAILTIFVFLLSLRSTLVAAVSIPLSILTALVDHAARGPDHQHHHARRPGGRRRSRRRRLDRGPREHLPPPREWARTGDGRRSTARARSRGASPRAPSPRSRVFLPIGFVGGIVSQFFLPFGLTVTFALLASLVVALTVIPVLAYFFMGKVNVKLDENGEPPEPSGSALHAGARARAAQPRHQVGHPRHRAGPVRGHDGARARCCRPASSTPAARRSWPSRSRRPPGASSDAVLARASRPRRSCGADQGGPGPVHHPGRGRHRLPDPPVGAHRPGRQQRPLTVRLDDVGRPQRLRRRTLPTALEPVKPTGTTSRSPRRSRASRATALASSSAATTPTDVAVASDALLAALGGRRTACSTWSPTCQRARPRSRSRVDPNKAIAAGLTAAQVAGEVRSALVGQTADHASSLGGPATAVAVCAGWIRRRITGVEALKLLPVGTAANACPLGELATSSRSTPRARHPRRRRPAATISARSPPTNTGPVSPGRPGRHRRPDADRAPSRRASTSARRRHPAAERGLRQPVLRDGLRDPRRLHRHGAGVRLAHHPAHHPVQPAAGHDRRLPGAAHHRPAARHQRPHRLPDAHRHRGHQRDRVAGPGGTAAAQGHVHRATRSSRAAGRASGRS